MIKGGGFMIDPNKEFNPSQLDELDDNDYLIWFVFKKYVEYFEKTDKIPDIVYLVDYVNEELYKIYGSGYLITAEFLSQVLIDQGCQFKWAGNVCNSAQKEVVNFGNYRDIQFLEK